MLDQGQFYPGQTIQFMDGLLTPIIGANQYRTDFSEYTIGVAPPDWSVRWGPTGFSVAVQSVAGSISGKALRWTKTAVNIRQGLSWDKIPTIADVEILIRFRVTAAWGNGDSLMFSSTRSSGASGAETAYRCNSNGTVSGTLSTTNINKVASGVNTNLGTATNIPSPNLAVNDWMWMRFRVIGSSLSRKTWHQGASEPGSFDETLTDSSLTAGGWTGLSDAGTAPATIEVDFFSVGLSGGSAPS